ncbi:hypothetical protein BGX23_005482 [Mortierella sp. AD031]|nr:hypothetical protein BGX23_005482 [Mortierella sp. AD031]
MTSRSGHSFGSRLGCKATLGSVIRNRVTVEDPKILMRGLANGLKHLHEMRIVHRNVKPENVLLRSLRDRQPLLADFGLAGFLETLTSELTWRCGTRTYLAPEVKNGIPYGTKVDTFALGAILRQFLHRPLAAMDIREGQELAKKLMREFPQFRLSAADALADPFLYVEEEEADKATLEPTLIDEEEDEEVGASPLEQDIEGNAEGVEMEGGEEDSVETVPMTVSEQEAVRVAMLARFRDRMEAETTESSHATDLSTSSRQDTTPRPSSPSISSHSQ